MQISPWKFWKLNLKSDPRPFPASFRQRGAFSNNILVGYLVFITHHSPVYENTCDETDRRKQNCTPCPSKNPYLKAPL